MARPMWFVKLLKKTFPNVKMIARMTRIPLIGRIVEHMLFQGDDIIYLPKDSVSQQVIQVGKALDKPIDTILPSQIVDHFIEEANFHWIMNTCICRDSLTCKDYPIDFGCLFLGEAAKGINPELGRSVSKEEALDYVKNVREAGLVHLIGRNKLDAVWLNVNPGEKLLTVCNCCPCCCLWRMLPDINPEIGDKVTRMSGVVVEVTDDCIGCGTCTQGICFVNAISLKDEKAVISEACRGCGRCVEVCPQSAIKLTIQNDDFMEVSIKRVSSVVDVK